MGLRGQACPKWRCAHYLSGAEAYLEVIYGRARIATKGLKKRGLFFECAIADNLQKMFKEAKLTYDFGVVILDCDEDPSTATLECFLSYNRDKHLPNAELRKKLGTSRSNLTAYNKSFEELVFKQNKKAMRSSGKR